MTTREALRIVFKELGETDEHINDRLRFADSQVAQPDVEIKAGMEREYIDEQKRLHAYFKANPHMLHEMIRRLRERVTKQMNKN